MKNEAILVTGAGGYIGSHMADLLKAEGRQVIVLDDFSTGFRDAIRDVKLYEGSTGDEALVARIFRENPVAAVIHFASFISVGESVAEPSKYYENNVSHTLSLLKQMALHDVKRFIFSSTAAVYGNPTEIPIPEHHPQSPINPYGLSKWMVERALGDFGRAYGMRSVCLRYFNAAGAHPLGHLGERHEPETHLIPLTLRAAAGRRPQLEVFGNDYPTPDGTCVRDYVHVSDLSAAHLLALDYLMDGGESAAFNLGNGLGFSVMEVIRTVEEVTGRAVPHAFHPRRAGDPPILVADSRLAKETLGWRPQFSDLKTIVQHAWAWECRS